MNALEFLNSSQSPATMNNIKQMWDMVRGANNPAGLVQQLAKSNPRLREALNEAGDNPKQAFFNKCQQLGVNPSEFLSQLK